MTTAMLFMTLKLKGQPIKGDVKLTGYEGQIALKSMGWGLDMKSKTGAKSDTTATKNWEGKELRITKVFDSATTALFGQVDERAGLRTSGASVVSRSKTDNEATISMVAVTALPDGEKLPRLMDVTLKGCRIKSISSRATESGNSVALTEDISLSYQDVVINYYPPVGPGDTRSGATTFTLEDKVTS